MFRDMLLEDLPQLVLGRRLAILIRLHHQPASLADLYAALSVEGFGAENVLPDEIDDKPPPRWVYRFREDLEALRSLGLDIGFDRRAGVYRWSNSPFGVSLSDSDLVALALLRRTFALPSFPHAGAIRALLEHLVDLLPRAQRDRLDRTPEAVVIDIPEASRYEDINSGLLEKIEGALRLRRQLEFDYRSPRHEETVRHRITPAPIIVKAGHVYLPGYEEGYSEQIDFRLERIIPKSVRLLPLSARKPARHVHTIRYRLRSDLVRGGISRHFMNQQHELQPDGSAIVSAQTGSLWAAHRVLLSYGPACRALAPPELVTMMEEAVLGMMQNYGVAENAPDK